MPTPRTSLRQPARAPSRFFRDYDAVALVRSGQPAVRARVRAAVATHRVITLVARRYFGFPTLTRVATRRPAPLAGRAICFSLEGHASFSTSRRRQFGCDGFLEFGHRCYNQSVGSRRCASDGRSIRGRGGGGGGAKAVGLMFLGASP